MVEVREKSFNWFISFGEPKNIDISHTAFFAEYNKVSLRLHIFVNKHFILILVGSVKWSDFFLYNLHAFKK